MKSIFMILTCLISFTFLKSTRAADDKKTAKPASTSVQAAPTTAYMESRSVFLEAMENPQTAEIFRLDQLEKFSTPFDRELREFFSHNEVFGQTFSYFQQNYDLILSDFSNSMLIGSTRIVRGLTTDYDRILKIIQETALDLGFNKDAISNLEVYVKSGSENAYTVSGLQNRIIIVFQRDILRTMSAGEIRAVIGHELGHIRGQHVITGQLNGLMLTLLNAYLVNGSVAQISMSDMEEDLRVREFQANQVLRDFETKMNASVVNVFEQYSTGTEMNHGDSATSSKVRNRYAGDSQKMGFDQQINTFMMRFMSQPHEFKRQIFSEYLEIIIRNLEATQSLSTTIDFFKTVYKNYQSGGTVLSVNPQEAGFHLQVASLAVSQAFETTSDMISNSVVKKSYLASAMAKLLGADFDGSRNKTGYESRQERQRIIEQHLKQAEEFRLRNQGDEAARFLSLMTHPAPVIRVEQIMALERYPAIIFADPFMRNLYLKDLLTLQLLNIEKRLYEVQAGVEKLKKQGRKIPANVVAIQKNLSQAYQNLSLQSETLDKQVLQMLLNPDKGGVTAPYKTLSNTVTQKDGTTTQENIREVSGSPRFEAYVRYLAAYRRELVARVALLEDLAKQYPENAEYFTYNIKLLKAQHALSKKFIKHVIETAQAQMLAANLDAKSQNVINARLIYIEKVATSLSIEDLTKILEQVQLSIRNGKDLPTEVSKESKLFSSNKAPLKMVIHDPVVTGSCKQFFAL